MIRIGISLILIVSTLYFPWWCSVIIIGIASLVIPSFIEAIVFGSIYDLVYGGGAYHSGIILGLILFLISLWAPRSIMIDAPWASSR